MKVKMVIFFVLSVILLSGACSKKQTEDEAENQTKKVELSIDQQLDIAMSVIVDSLPESQMEYLRANYRAVLWARPKIQGEKFVYLQLDSEELLKIEKIRAYDFIIAKGDGTHELHVFSDSMISMLYATEKTYPWEQVKWKRDGTTKVSIDTAFHKRVKLTPLEIETRSQEHMRFWKTIFK